jgi:hypothetical protein
VIALLPLQIDPAVIAAYVGSGLTGILALIAIFISISSLRFQKESARAATISAEAAQRANYISEQRMQNELSRGTTEVNIKGDLITADASDVRWSLDRKGKNTYVLRNVGTAVAEEVRIPPEGAAPISRSLPESATLRPGESVEFLMIGALGAPVPNEILLTWKGRPETDPLILPVPS